MSRRFVAALVLLTFTLPALAQRRAPGTSIPDLIDVRVRVLYTNDRTVPRMVRVQLLSGTGLYAAESFTDDLGSVEFRVGPGNYRVRVSGSDIEETTTDIFTVFSRQGSHTETVTVERKPVEGGGAMSTQGTISMVDLNVPRKAERELEKGVRAMEKKALQKAEEHFRKAIEVHAGYATAHNYLGVVMMQSGRPAEGRAAFARAVELNDSYSAAHVNMAKVYFGEKNAKDAEGHLVKALKTDPLNPEILTLLSNAQLVNGNFQDAVANARKAHSVPHDQFAIVHYVAARALEAARQPNDAVAEYNQYLKEAPQGPLAEESRGRIEAFQRGPN
jgi:tetratricopeptide (TPR) repeat protein